jgi:hypothetical protein
MDYTLFGKQMEVQIGHYAKPQNVSIQLWDNEGPYATPSWNPPFPLAPTTVAVKDYSENESMVTELRGAGIIGKQIGTVASGFVEIGVFELLI